MPYSLQFSQNISDYSGHSTSKNTLWKPLASSNRQTYLGVCAGLSRIRFTVYFDNLLTQHVSTQRALSQSVSELCCLHPLLIFFLNYSPPNHSAFVVWQRPVAQVISIYLLKITRFKERKGHLFIAVTTTRLEAWLLFSGGANQPKTKQDLGCHLLPQSRCVQPSQLRLCDISLCVCYLHVYNPIHFDLYKINHLKIPTVGDI